MLSPLFPSAKANERSPLVIALEKAAPETFASGAGVRRFLQLIWFPASRRWRYQLNGKSGNTFTLNLLFELEFGARFTCRLSDVDNQHPDFALFLQGAARLLGNPLSAGDDLDAVLAFPGLSIATVRNPFDRARSGFHYLCRSHEVGDRRFLSERLRLNALVRFDWDSDRHTPTGFGKFLEYVTLMGELEGPEALDPHWMPQVLHIRPELYRPDLIGRTENLTPFAIELAERLDRPLPDLGPLKVNRGRQVDSDLYDDPARARMVRQIYSEDFEAFGYDAEPVGR